jgi:hypothetical protein
MPDTPPPEDFVREAENGRPVVFPRRRDSERPVRVFTGRAVLGFFLGNIAILLGFGYWVTNTYIDQRAGILIRIHNNDPDAHNARLKEFSVAGQQDRQNASLEAKIDRVDQKVQAISEQLGEMRGEMRARAKVDR